MLTARFPDADRSPTLARQPALDELVQGANADLQLKAAAAQRAPSDNQAKASYQAALGAAKARLLDAMHASQCATTQKSGSAESPLQQGIDALAQTLRADDPNWLLEQLRQPDITAGCQPHLPVSESAGGAYIQERRMPIAPTRSTAPHTPIEEHAPGGLSMRISRREEPHTETATRAHPAPSY
ncbi:hypothetical protein [Ralstonia sp. 1138]|uniref:hypothetical protein n=1 Tax=Ralstonia sp. 1138 TaxID=3156423 RepID=UPI0033915AE1